MISPKFAENVQYSSRSQTVIIHPNAYTSLLQKLVLNTTISHILSLPDILGRRFKRRAAISTTARASNLQLYLNVGKSGRQNAFICRHRIYSETQMLVILNALLFVRFIITIPNSLLVSRSHQKVTNRLIIYLM